MRFDLSNLPMTTAGVTLRLWTPDDAAWYVESRDDVIFRMTTESCELTVDAAREAITDYLRDPSCASFAILDEEDLVGSIGLVVKDTSGRVGEVYYWLAPSGRGRGVATKALESVCRWAFETLPSLQRIELEMLPENIPSRRVAERAGFRLDGDVHEREWKGGRVEVVRYACVSGVP